MVKKFNDFDGSAYSIATFESFSSQGDPWNPDEWKNTKEWETLTQLGFRDITTPIIRKNGNILITNDSLPMGYSSGVVLQSSGYIRDKNAKSGFIKKYSKEMDRGDMLRDMFNYLIAKWDKEVKRRNQNKENAGSLPSDIVDLLNGITTGNWKWNEQTERIDVNGGVAMARNESKIKKLKGYRFGKVTGNFFAIDCNLQDLSIGPDYVGGDYTISKNSLTSLKGAPSIVKGEFNVNENNLGSAEGCPRVGTNISMRKNQLSNLKGLPEAVNGNLELSENQIVSLEGSPKMVKGVFFLSHNFLRNLEGGPEEIKKLYVTDNPLKSFKGYPKKVILSHHDFKNSGIFFDSVKYSVPYKERLSSTINMPPNQYGIYDVGTLLDYMEEIKIAVDERRYNYDVDVEHIHGLIARTLEYPDLLAYFKENPLKIHLLDFDPDLKGKIIKELGIRDISKLSKRISQGLI